jgi:hypothetical protein
MNAVNAAIIKARSTPPNAVKWLPVGSCRSFALALSKVPTQDRGIKDYLQLWKLAGKLDAYNRRAVLPILGAEIDLCNIIWLYRLTHFREITGEAAFAHLVPVRWRLSRGYLRGLAEGANFFQKVKEGYYSKIFSDFVQPERAVRAALLRMCKIQAIAYPNSIARVVAQW